MIGIPAAYFDGIRARTAQRSRHREKILETEHEVEIAQIEATTRIERVAIDRLITDEVCKQANREAVGVAAADALRIFPAAPESSGSRAEGKPMSLRGSIKIG